MVDALKINNNTNICKFQINRFLEMNYEQKFKNQMRES